MIPAIAAPAGMAISTIAGMDVDGSAVHDRCHDVALDDVEDRRERDHHDDRRRAADAIVTSSASPVVSALPM